VKVYEDSGISGAKGRDLAQGCGARKIPGGKGGGSC
jgi:hypothetical protein